MRVVYEPEFRERLSKVLEPLRGRVKSVVGPGRSGAVASVYASHFLGVPFLLPSLKVIPDRLKPILIIDTAVLSGATLKRLAKRYGRDVVARHVFKEPPIVKFWYETFMGKRLKKTNKINSL